MSRTISSGSRAECIKDDRPQADAQLTPAPGSLKETHELRTYRRPLALAATCLPVLLGLGLAAGIQPAAAATSDCGGTSTRADGQLDAGRLQACLLEQVQSSFSAHELPVIDVIIDDVIIDDLIIDDVVYNLAGPSHDALEVVLDEPAVEEVAPAESGLGGAFAALRDCESGGDYGINTGNGYYGAYQFALSSWQGLGYGGYPHEASPATQDQAASELQSLYGWGQWPACSWYLGL